MRILLIFITVIFLNAETLNFILPFNDSQIKTEEINDTRNIQPISENNTTRNEYTRKNSQNYENNETKQINELNVLIPQIPKVEEDFNDTYVSINSKVKFAIVIDKKRFFKFIPSLMNALDAYLAQKGINYNVKLYDKDINLSQIKSKDILYFATDENNISQLCDYNKTFYLPLINKNDTNISCENIYFGGIDFNNQIEIISQFIDDKTDIVTDNTIISKKLLNYEKNLTLINNVYRFPNIYYNDLNNSFVISNIAAGKTAQVLSQITQKNIDTKLIFSPQLGYNPLLISLTQPIDIEKLIIANSIIHSPQLINEYARVLNSDIKYNWINFASTILANKIYNAQNDEDEFYMSDFNIYIFDNQINYKTKLYRIINGAFKPVE